MTSLVQLIVVPYELLISFGCFRRVKVFMAFAFNNLNQKPGCKLFLNKNKITKN